MSEKCVLNMITSIEILKPVTSCKTGYRQTGNHLPSLMFSHYEVIAYSEIWKLDVENARREYLTIRLKIDVKNYLLSSVCSF